MTKVIEVDGIEYSILEDSRNDITIFSFYENEPDEDGIYSIKLRYVHGVNYSNEKLIKIIKDFNN